MYDPVESVIPNELSLNFEPQGGLVKGFVSQPNALVLLYPFIFIFVVNKLTTSSEKTFVNGGCFPLFSNILINSPTF